MTVKLRKFSAVYKAKKRGELADATSKLQTTSFNNQAPSYNLFSIYYYFKLIAISYRLKAYSLLLDLFY